MRNLLKSFNIDFRHGIIYFALISLWIFFTVLTGGNFLTPRNLSNIVRVISTTSILACSTVLVIVSGGIDLSAGFAAMFTGCTAAMLMVRVGISVPLAITITIVIGMLIGLANGFIIANTGLAPFIVTLATGMIYYGLSFLVTDGGRSISPLPARFNWLGQGHISSGLSITLTVFMVALLLFFRLRSRNEKLGYGFKVDSIPILIIKWAFTAVCLFAFINIMNAHMGLPVSVLIMIIVMLALQFISAKTIWGRSIYAIGGNREAAHYSGIKVAYNWMFVFMMQSTMATIAGMLLAARVNAGSMQNAVNLHTDAIAAAVIGGTSMRGGVGKVTGAILGALFMSTIDNGMSMLNVNVAWQFIAKGCVLAVAIILDALSKKGK